MINAGGPAGPPPLWKALGFGGRHHAHALGLFEQLFDGPAPSGGGSSTLTYLLGDRASGEAILIDPVLEQVTWRVAWRHMRRRGCHMGCHMG